MIAVFLTFSMAWVLSNAQAAVLSTDSKSVAAAAASTTPSQPVQNPVSVAVSSPGASVSPETASSPNPATGANPSVSGTMSLSLPSFSLGKSTNMGASVSASSPPATAQTTSPSSPFSSKDFRIGQVRSGSDSTLPA